MSQPETSAERAAVPRPNGRHDVLTHRLVVISLGATVLLTGASITVLAVLGRDVPPSLPALGGTALGALTRMLATIMRPGSH